MAISKVHSVGLPQLSVGALLLDSKKNQGRPMLNTFENPILDAYAPSALKFGFFPILLGALRVLHASSWEHKVRVTTTVSHSLSTLQEKVWL